jgi:hypothetical protein
MRSKEVLLTFDYELFLGSKSGSVENCLIKPTQLVLDILEQYQAKSVFFIDTLYLCRLEKENSAQCKSDLQLIYKQLDAIVNQGHTIGIHIHPHWLDATFNDQLNNWNGENKSRFALSNLSIEEINNVVANSVRILKPFLDMNQDLTYRAGGFYCQPFSLFASVFQNHKILIDFSVMRDYTSTGHQGLYSFDFSNPPSKFIYRFKDDPLLIDNSGLFIEMSVNSFQLQGISKIQNSIYYRRNKEKSAFKRMGDGSGSGNIIAHKNKSVINKYLISDQTFSIELLNPELARAYTNFFDKNAFMHFVSHPKLFTQNGLDGFGSFLKNISHRNPLFDYKTMIKNNLS